ncbi:MAG: GAF domain-containing protein, partial [Cyanobacteria bacterium J06576_12]
FKYVTKPWEEDDLRTVVGQAVDTHSVLQARTQELNRVVRQETLLNAITNTIRSAQSSQDMLKVIVETLGEAFELDYGIVKPISESDLHSPMFHYVGTAVPEEQLLEASGRTLAPQALAQLERTVWETVLTQHLETAEEITAAAPDEANAAAYEALDIHTSLLIPLTFKQDVLAILALHKSSQQKPWEESEIKLLTTLADQAALALSQTWTYERVQSLAQREVLINTITQALHASLDPSEIFAAITEKLGQALYADTCTLSLWQDDRSQCVGRYDMNVETSPTLPQPSISIEQDAVLAELRSTGQPVVISASDQKSMSIETDTNTRALMALPLLADAKITGCIVLRQVSSDRQWQKDEVGLAVAVANQAAIAVQQANLYQKSRHQAEQLLELDQQKNA